MTRFRNFSFALAGVTALALTFGCSNYRDQLNRGQGYYSANEYEKALAVWRNLEGDRDSLEPMEQVRYFYLRGMTDFRLGYRDHARYWLGLAKAGYDQAQGALRENEAERLQETLKELNHEVWGVDESAGAAAGAPCETDLQCGDDGQCVEGKCAPLNPAEAPIDPDADAPAAPGGSAAASGTSSNTGASGQASGSVGFP